MAGQKMPPVTQVGMISLGLIVAGGIYLTANIPGEPSLAPAIILLLLSASLLAVNILTLARVEGFAWKRFFDVGKWSFLAYLVIAGLIEYAFVRNDVSGGTLIVLTLSLVVFALQVPLLIGFTVARYE